MAFVIRIAYNQRKWRFGLFENPGSSNEHRRLFVISGRAQPDMQSGLCTTGGVMLCATASTLHCSTDLSAQIVKISQWYSIEC